KTLKLGGANHRGSRTNSIVIRRVKETVSVERVKPDANKSRIAITIPRSASPKQTAKAVLSSTPETYNMLVIMAWMARPSGGAAKGGEITQGPRLLATG